MKYSPYSFSRMDLFEKCPLSFKYTYIDKIGQFVPNLALEKGSYIHTLLENHTKDKETRFNFKISTIEQQESYIDIFRDFLNSELGSSYLNVEAEAEVNFGVKKGPDGLVPCSYYDKESLFRGKIDHSIYEGEMIQLIDWKTGKVTNWPAPLQLVMYAVWAFLFYPEINIIRTAFVYVEHNQEKPYTFKREMLPTLTTKVLEKILNMEKEENFRKKEGPLCNFCDYRKARICLPETHDEFQNKMFEIIRPKGKK